MFYFIFPFHFIMRPYKIIIFCYRYRHRTICPVSVERSLQVQSVSLRVFCVSQLDHRQILCLSYSLRLSECSQILDFLHQIVNIAVFVYQSVLARFNQIWLQSDHSARNHHTPAVHRLVWCRSSAFVAIGHKQEYLTYYDLEGSHNIFIFLYCNRNAMSILKNAADYR